MLFEKSRLELDFTFAVRHGQLWLTLHGGGHRRAARLRS